MESRVLVVGAGGFGSSAAYALSRLGIGTIGFINYDTVELSNLNRQILHSTSRIGMSKVESAKAFINNLSSEINVVAYNTSLNNNNAMYIVAYVVLIQK